LFYYTDEVQSNPRNNSASWFFNALCRADLNAGEDALNHYDERKESIEVRLRLFVFESTPTVRDFIDLDVNLTSVSIGSAVNEIVAVDVAFEGTVATRGTQSGLRNITSLPVRRSNL